MLLNPPSGSGEAYQLGYKDGATRRKQCVADDQTIEEAVRKHDYREEARQLILPQVKQQALAKYDAAHPMDPNRGREALERLLAEL